MRIFGYKHRRNHSKNGSDIEDRSGSLVQRYPVRLLHLIDAMMHVSDAVYSQKKLKFPLHNKIQTKLF